jgi:hypothetical protein
MLNAQSIYKLLIDDLPPAGPDPLDPVSLEKEAERYLGNVHLARGIHKPLYAAWKQLLNGRNTRRMTGLGRATWLDDIGDMIALRLHETDVIRVDAQDKVTVNMGKWKTRVSVDRINWAGPGGWRLWGQKSPAAAFDTWNFYWYNPDTGIGFRSDPKAIPFTNGDEILPDGTLRHQAEPVQAHA